MNINLCFLLHEHMFVLICFAVLCLFHWFRHSMFVIHSGIHSYTKRYQSQLTVIKQTGHLTTKPPGYWEFLK